MTRNKIIVPVFVVICIALIVWIVTPSREEKAKAQLDAVYKIEQSGQFDQAVSLYETLIAEYKETRAAAVAADNIVRVQKYKERALIQQVSENLDRIILVLNGYRQMMGSNPSSLGQLDSGEYMFDSDYIAEIVPEGYTYTLLFTPEGTYKLYSQADGDAKVVKKSARGSTVVLAADDMKKEVNVDGLEKIEKGRMVFLQPG